MAFHALVDQYLANVLGKQFLPLRQLLGVIRRESGWLVRLGCRNWPSSSQESDRQGRCREAKCTEKTENSPISHSEHRGWFFQGGPATPRATPVKSEGGEV
jgi:hypothetical protein